MVKFIIQAIAFFLICIIAFIGFVLFNLNFVPASTNEYMQGAFDKHMHLYDSRPQIILIGGSNLAFGMDSAQLEEAFDMDVANMGLHAGLDLNFMLDSVKYEISKDDTVVVLMEYNNYTNSPLHDQDTIYRYVKYYPFALRFVDFNIYGNMFINEIPAIIKSGMLNLQNYLKTKKVRYNGIYDRNGFNKYGDLTAHWELGVGNPDNYGTILPEKTTINEAAVKYLEDFCYYLKNKVGVKEVYIGFPPACKGNINEANAKMVDERLRKSTAFTVIGSYDRYILNSKYFYDTFYHLNGEGAKLRTSMLVEDLSPYFKS